VQFKHRAACMVEQYSRYTVDGVAVNGRLTLGENIADNGGVRLGLAALETLAAEEAAKAGRGRGTLSAAERRLYFTAWGQNWCTVERRRAEALQLMTDEHAPDRVRVNAPLANSPDFASAFSCPAGAPMNPARRCVLW
jgi:predicted metalloendopeptidase